MPAYITITDPETDPDAPLTSELAKKWRDNPLAIAEGAAGAPRVDLGALVRLTPGTTIKYRRDSVTSASNSSSVTTFFFDFLQKGTIRLTFDHSAGGPTFGTAKVIRFRLGVETELASYANTSSYVSRSVDCAVEPYDRIGLVMQSNSSNWNVRNCRFQNGGENLWLGEYFPIENNTYS